MTYTQEQLIEAFRMVQDRANWKLPVNTLIPGDYDQNLVYHAVIHFTGSVPMFETLKSGWVRVTAAGYYAAIGS